MRALTPALLLALAVSAGCMKVTYTTGLQPAGASSTRHEDFFVFGLAGESTVDMASLCPQGVAWWQSRTEVVDWLLSCVTCSIYTPRTIEVQCAAGGSALLLQPDEENGVTWVTELPAGSFEQRGAE